MACSSIRYTKCVVAMAWLVAAGCDGWLTDGSPAKTLNGEYHIVSGERNGTTISPHELKNAIMIITGDRIIAYDNAREETFAATYTLDTSRSPWRIMMTITIPPETSHTSQGLLEMDQGLVRLIYALPNGPSPIAFRTGERQQMFVMIKD